MANTPKWNIRMRHEWLATPLKMKRVKRCQSARVGLLDAQLRKFLYTSGPVGEAGDGDTDGGSAAAAGSLGIGSLKGAGR